jgi:hypothetical protein
MTTLKTNTLGEAHLLNLLQQTAAGAILVNEGGARLL